MIAAKRWLAAINGDLYVAHYLGTSGIETFNPPTMTSLGIFPHANFASHGNNQLYGLNFIPEPATGGLISLGMLFVLNWRRKA